MLDGAAVLDKETGLVWDKSPDTTTRTWLSATSHCYRRELGCRKGWHLPIEDGGIKQIKGIDSTSQETVE